MIWLSIWLDYETTFTRLGFNHIPTIPLSLRNINKPQLTPSPASTYNRARA